MKFVFTGILVLHILCRPTFATANDTPANADLTAKEMYAQGLHLFENTAYAAAAKAFRKANELNYHWKVLYNIGQSEAAAKRHGPALAAFEEYLSRGGDDIPVSRHQEVIAEVARLRMICGYITINAPNEIDIIIDGVHRGKTPISTPLPLSARVEHELVAQNATGEIHREIVEVSGGQTIEMDIGTKTETAPTEMARQTEKAPDIVPDAVDDAAGEESASPQQTTVASANPPRSRSRLKPLGIAALATGLSLTVAGIVTGIKAYRDSETLRDDCGGTLCDDTHQGDIARVETLDNVGTIFIGAGTAVVMTGVILMIIHKKQKDSFLPISVGAAVSPGKRAVIFEWRF